MIRPRLFPQSWPFCGNSHGGAIMGWAAVAAVLLLSGCASGTGGDAVGAVGASFGPGYPPGSAGWTGEARVAYRDAFMAGMQDQREGFRFNDDRGAALVGEAVRGLYRTGYRRGYYHKAGNGLGSGRVES